MSHPALQNRVVKVQRKVPYWVDTEISCAQPLAHGGRWKGLPSWLFGKYSRTLIFVQFFEKQMCTMCFNVFFVFCIISILCLSPPTNLNRNTNCTTGNSYVAEASRVRGLRKFTVEDPWDAIILLDLNQFWTEESKIACTLFVQILNVRRGLPAPVCASHDKQRAPRPRELKLFRTAFFWGASKLR